MDSLLICQVSTAAKAVGEAVLCPEAQNFKSFIALMAE